MDLEYEWQQYGSLRKGGQLSFSLMITCTRWWRTEKVPFRLVDGSGQLSPKDGYIELEAGKSVRIDYDTYDWDWCNGDFIIIFDKKGREYDRIVFNKRTYAPGECPECHGSHQCVACKGTGRVMDRLRQVSTCQRCLGTGLCQTCYVPTRQAGAIYNIGNVGASVSSGTNPNVELSRQRKIIDLRKRIADLESMINHCEYDAKMRKLDTAIHGYDTSRTTDDMRQAQLKYTYQSQLIQLKHELEQLELRGL